MVDYDTKRQLDEFMDALRKELEDIKRRLDRIERSGTSFRTFTVVDDTYGIITPFESPPKKLSLQHRLSPPPNAAYIAFNNNPNATIFYLVLEDHPVV